MKYSAELKKLSRHNRKLLVFGIAALLLLASTQVGGTEAYFTDSATSRGNVVSAGLWGVTAENATATIDFQPDTLNLKSEGRFVTVYIELPEGFYVEDIDLSSILLNGTVPALPEPTEIGDYDDDGIPDLMVKFERAAVQGVLTVGEEVEITITGEGAGITFEGVVIIRVIDPPGKGSIAGNRTTEEAELREDGGTAGNVTSNWTADGNGSGEDDSGADDVGGNQTSDVVEVGRDDAGMDNVAGNRTSGGAQAGQDGQDAQDALS